MLKNKLLKLVVTLILPMLMKGSLSILALASCQQGNDSTEEVALLALNPKKLIVVDGQFQVMAGDTPRSVSINEIAWMGTSASANAEWIELKNNTASSISLSGWILNSRDGTPAITLTGTISANGYYLLERTSDSTVSGVTANQIYTGALTNTGEYLDLKNSGGTIIDSVDKWHAGSNTTMATMERIDPLGSGTSVASWTSGTKTYTGGMGTPKAANGSGASDGTGSDANCSYPSQLEITSINIGQGDATLIASKTKLLLADAGETNWNSHNDADKVAEVIRQKYGTNCKTIDYVVISHMHLDHIGYIQAEEDTNGNLFDEFGGSFTEGENLRNPVFYAGLAYLVKNHGFKVSKTVLRDYKTHNPNKDPSAGGSKTYRNWRAHLSSPKGIADFHPVTGVLGTSTIDMGKINGVSVIVDIIQVDAATPSNPIGCSPATYFGGSQYLVRGDRSQDVIPPSENDLSLAFVINYGNFNMFIGGDTSGENYQSQFGYRYHDTESCLANDAILRSKYAGKIDVLRGNHHGSSHSSNQAFIDFVSPLVTVYSVGDNNTYGHIDRAVLDRALYRTVYLNGGRVFLTESGAGVTAAAQLCHSAYTSTCAIVADNEFPTSTESNETGDPGVAVKVSLNGNSFTVEGNPAQGSTVFTSR